MVTPSTVPCLCRDEPFAVLYGDDVIIGDDPVCGQLCRVYEEYGKSVVGIKQVTAEQVLRYCSLAVSPVRDNIFTVSDMIEKPTPDKVLSLYSVLGRNVLTPDIFDILDRTAPGVGGEIQLTDALRIQAQNGNMMGVDFVGKRYDMGNKLGYCRPTVGCAARLTCRRILPLT